MLNTLKNRRYVDASSPERILQLHASLFGKAFDLTVLALTD